MKPCKVPIVPYHGQLISQYYIWGDRDGSFPRLPCLTHGLMCREKFNKPTGNVKLLVLCC